MATVYLRRAVTNHLLAALNTSSVVTGDMERPSGGGWQGEPYQSAFSPFCVLTPATGTAFGSLADPSSEATLRYAATTYGSSREQCEWGADVIRAAAKGIQRDTIAMGFNAVVLWVAFTYGGVVGEDTDAPTWYAQTDDITVYLSK